MTRGDIVYQNLRFDLGAKFNRPPDYTRITTKLLGDVAGHVLVDFVFWLAGDKLTRMRIDRIYALTQGHCLQ